MTSPSFKTYLNESIFFAPLDKSTTTVTTLRNQESQSITATYKGEQDGTYIIADGDIQLSFDAIEATVETVLDETDKAIGKIFKVTFVTTDEEDENRELTEIRTIKGLALQ